ncbi:MAG: glycosyltransferase family 4 protein [Methylocystis sp.]
MKTPLLIVTDDASDGGTYKVSERLIFELEQAFNLQFGCMFNELNKTSREAIEALGVKTHNYRIAANQLSRSTFDENGAEDLLRIVKPSRILFVDCCIWSHLALKEAAQKHGIPYVMIVNLVMEEWRDRFPQLREPAAKAAKAAHAIIFVSEANKKIYEKFFPDSNRDMLAIPNGAPERFFSPTNMQTRKRLRESLRISEDDIVFLMTARIEPRKGQSLSLRALEEVRKHADITTLKLVIAGFGPQHAIDALRREISARGLTENVIVLGLRNDVPDLLDACDVYLLPSYGEGSPLSIKEAMAKGRPVITTDLDEIREQIDAGCCMLAPSPNLSETACVTYIATMMRGMRENEDERLKKGVEARDYAQRWFREKPMIEAYERILLDTPTSNCSWRGADQTIRDSGLASGSTVSFSKPRDAWKYLKDGWSDTEEVGIWSIGDCSVVKLNMMEASRDWRFVFDLRAFANDRHSQTTSVLVNDREVDSWCFNTEAREQRVVRAQFKEPTNSLEIKFIHHAPNSPRRVGISEDARELGVFLYSLVVEKPSVWQRIKQKLRSWWSPVRRATFTATPAGRGKSHRRG